MALWRVELFGGLRLSREGGAVLRFSTQKTALILAYLTLNAGHAHPREALAALLWPDADDETGRHNLRTALYSLRRQLEPHGVVAGTVVVADRMNVRLNPEAITSDTAEFAERLADAASATERASRLEALQAAAGLYRGELLPGFYEPWVLAERDHLASRFLLTLKTIADELLAVGDLDGAAEYTHRAVAADPYDEEAHCRLIRVFAAMGRYSQALQQYRALTKMLREYLGVEPAPETRLLVGEVEALARRRADRVDVPEAKKRVQRLAPASAVVTVVLVDAADALPRRLVEAALAPFSESRLERLGHQTAVFFPRPSDAIGFAAALDRDARAHGARRPRVAIDSGEIEAGGAASPALGHVREMAAAAHEGQTICSEATRALVGSRVPDACRFEGLGVYRFGDMVRVYRVVIDDATDERFPPLRAERGFAGGLPIYRTAFMGRDAELERLDRMLAEDREQLVALVGPGGAGKTRLAVELARRLYDRYHGLVWFVQLGELEEASHVPAAVRDAIRPDRPATHDPIAAVEEAVGDAPAIVFLDCCERLEMGRHEFFEDLLLRAPGLQFVMTSRRTPDVAGARVVRVEPLPVPTASASLDELVANPCVQLYVDRVKAVRPDFGVTASNAAAIADLCAKLEGIALAVELAAARERVLPAGHLLKQLDRRFDLLVSRQRNAPERHRTLRAAIDWSYQALDPDLRVVLSRLAVFRGGWSAAAAEVVCQSPFVLDDLEQLLDHSLVEREEAGGDVRFRMLDTIREFAAEQLDEEETLRARRLHADVFEQLAERARVELFGPQHTTWLARLDVELENLRAAMAWSTANSRATACLHIASSLLSYWTARGRMDEARVWLARGVEAGGNVDDAVLAGAFQAAGLLAYFQSDYEVAARMLESSHALYASLGNRRFATRVSSLLGTVSWATGDYERALAILRKDLEAAREIGDSQAVASINCNLGLVHLSRDERDIAEVHLDESLALMRETGELLNRCIVLNNLASLRIRRGELEVAHGLLDESLELSSSLELAREKAGTLSNLGNLALLEGDPAAAASHYGASYEGFTKLGDLRGTSGAVDGLGSVAASRDQHELAAQLFGAAHCMRARTGDLMVVSPAYERYVSIARAALGDDIFDKLFAEERGPGLEALVARVAG